jgi:hypothetical protein
MNINKTIFSLGLLCALSVNAQEERKISNDYKLNIFVKHIKYQNNIRVQYDLNFFNGSNQLIYGFIVGETAVANDEPAIIMPSGEFSKIIFNSPKNWTGENIHLSESYQNYFKWSTTNSSTDADAIQPKTTKNGFSAVTLNKYPTIFSTVASIDTVGSSYSKVIKLTKGDTTKPTASISATVTPTPKKAGFYTVNVKLSAKDNYDPLPEIAFKSIKTVGTGASTSPFASGSYTLNTPNNSSTGAYPTAITVAADAKVAKSYQLTYTVTDASDNATTVSTTVTVPKR